MRDTIFQSQLWMTEALIQLLPFVKPRTSILSYDANIAKSC